MSKRCVVLFLIFALFFVRISLYGQSVAVVLSGGGAKGLAHIGVLKALEENNIPIDYIAGTSMGAIVGGMYACGFSVDEMIELFNSEEFSIWLSGEIEEEYQFYYKRDDNDAEWINARFDIDTVISPRFVPTSIISPVQMDFAFLNYFSRPSAACGYDFDKLMIPFRCVTSNIEDNKAYICRSGDVGSAVRASMSFPFYFKPITINGKVMMDGGMYNNFPVDVVQEDFNPDIIIGSVVAGNYDKPSTDDMISILQSIFMSQTNYSLPDSVGLIVRPNVRSLELLDFSRPNDIIDSGYVTTIRDMEAIKDKITRRIIPSDVALKRSIFKDKFPPLLFQNIYPIGIKNRQSDYVNRLLKQEADLVNTTQLKPNYFRLIADDKIASVYPRSRFNPGTGYFDLYLDIEPAKDFTISFGGDISSSATNQAFIGFRYKLLNRNSWTFAGNAYVGRFYNSFLLKARLEYPFEPPFYAEVSGVYNSWNYFSTSRYFIGDESPSFLLQQDNYLRLTLGVPVTNVSKLSIDLVGMGLTNSYYHTNSFTRQDTSDITSFSAVSVGMIFDHNTLNRKIYSNEGKRLTASLRYVGGMEKHSPGSTSLDELLTEKPHRWLQLKVHFENYFRSIGPVILGVYADGVLSNQNLFSNYTASVLQAPAYKPVVQSKILFIPEYRATIYAGLGIKGIVKLINSVDLQLESFGFLPYQQIKESDDQTAYLGKTFAENYFGGAATLVYSNSVLPVSLSFTYYGGTEEPFQVLFNLGYLIFNKRSLY